MRNAYFSGNTVDDVLRDALQAIQEFGERVKASKGHTKEVRGIMIELCVPRARLSRTESRGKPFSCLGELCWYLAGTNKTEFIAHYIPKYSEFDEKGMVWGGYGPRLFGHWKGLNQFENVIELLKKSTSRQAVLQLFDSTDLTEPEHKDIPCTCTLQFLVRDGHLHLVTYMRSNDVIKGFPHDVFCFTMLQEIAARTLGVDLGLYHHCVGSLHLYDTDQEKAESFLKEGWQSTKSAMPPMPIGEPQSSIALLLKAEATIRLENQIDQKLLIEMDPYWADLVRLLQILNSSKRGNEHDMIREIRQSMTSPIYDTYIEGVLGRVGKA